MEAGREDDSQAGRLSGQEEMEGAFGTGRLKDQTVRNTEKRVW